MLKSDFHYDLPESLIAQEPLLDRTASRLLHLDGNTGAMQDKQFSGLREFLNPGDLLVFNNTRVLPARLYAEKPTGGRVELLIERVLQENLVLAQARSSKPLRQGSELLLADGVVCRVLGREMPFYRIEFLISEPLETLLQRIGHMPLPPYIRRDDTEADQQRYQTVFAEKPGAVAAPTAGLHFDHGLLADIADMGVTTAFVTLHVGSGTFQPVRVENLDDHVMHKEVVEVGDELVSAVAQAERVIAVGSTSVRSLETAARSGQLQCYSGETDIFIQPGFCFNCVDAMITNFHLPESTLMAMVCAFGGYDSVMAAYRHAVAEQYRFFSYGDAMFINRKTR